MSARRKKGSPMKYRGFYCPDDLWTEMQHCAEIVDESDSEYIRKAVEMRNVQINAINKVPAEKIIEKFINDPDSFDIKPIKPGTMKADKQQEFRTFFKK